MSSKEEIKQLFITELKATQEYQIILDIKQKIINEITTPNIQENIIYTFQNPLTTEQQNNIKLCMQVEFGFISDCNADFTIINMIKFLE